jgi:hypothetical protein
MTIEIINRKKEDAQKQLNLGVEQLRKLEENATTLSSVIHNLKVQIATYDDLLSDDTAAVSEEVRETIEGLVAGE